MVDKSLEARAQEVIAEILDVDEELIVDEFGPESSDNWDSMNNLRMITALEEEFKISFSMEEISSMVNMKAISEMISQKSQ